MSRSGLVRSGVHGFSNPPPLVLIAIIHHSCGSVDSFTLWRTAAGFHWLDGSRRRLSKPFDYSIGRHFACPNLSPAPHQEARQVGDGLTNGGERAGARSDSDR
jgi:hypothetical protein